MKKLTKSEQIGVSVALIVVFSFLFFGSKIFQSNNMTALNNGQISENLDAGRVVKAGDTVSVHYTGKFINGTKFDSSLDRGEPITFTVGSGQLIKGFDDGVVGMKVGEERSLTIPPELGYGAQKVGPVPANSTLIFDVKVVSIK